MEQPNGPFKDFGILPSADLGPPAGTFRAFVSPKKLAGQYLYNGTIAAVGVGLMVVFAVLTPPPQSIIGGITILLGFTAIVCLGTDNDYRWIELEGSKLRAKHTYNGRVVERSIDEIDSLGTMYYAVQRKATALGEKIDGRVMGVEIRFCDGRTPLRIKRSDPAMTNAEELVKAVVYRMSLVGDLVPDIAQIQGRPLVRTIGWQGKEPQTPSGTFLKLILAFVTFMALLFGSIISYWGCLEREHLQIGSQPVHLLTLASLIKNGPGENRHVTITDFQDGGYVVKTEDGRWREVTVALFPSSGAENEIPAVLTIRSVEDFGGLVRLLAKPITGVCSAERSSNWGFLTKGPELVKANQGLPLNSAWVIEEMSEPPSAAKVDLLLNGSLACFAAVWICAGSILWMIVR